MNVAGQRRGVLAAVCTRYDRFSAEDQAFLEAVARWTSMLMHRSELAEALLSQAEERGRREGRQSLLAHLTPRQAEVAVLIANGYSNQEIAHKLVLNLRHDCQSRRTDPGPAGCRYTRASRDADRRTRAASFRRQWLHIGVSELSRPPGARARPPARRWSKSCSASPRRRGLCVTRSDRLARSTRSSPPGRSRPECSSWTLSSPGPAD